ncbi:MAG: ABC transporter ATP-binding protein [Planctomycetota bacterium]
MDNLKLKRDGVELFDGLSFSIQSGRRICVQGRSGSGKSTLLKALAGLVVPDAGQIAIAGQEMTGKTVWDLRKKIACVSQEPDLGQGTALDRIRQPFSYHANAHLQCSSQQIHDYCDVLKLERKLLNRDVTELSGGEKQRIAIVIAFLLNRPILLLDEPISALDKESKAAFRQLLADDSERTVLFVSHDDLLLEIAHETIGLDKEGGNG